MKKSHITTPFLNSNVFCCALNSVNISHEQFTHLNRTAPSEYRVWRKLKIKTDCS